MARLPLVEFRNQCDPKGYHLERRGTQFVIQRNGRVQEELKDCLPLRGNEYLEFASIRDAEDALAFVRRHGALTQLGNFITDGCADHVPGFLQEAQLFREILDAVKEGPPRLSEELLDHMSLQAQRVRKSLIWDPVAERLVWQARTYDLYSSLWAQLIQGVTRGDQVRECDYCRKLFEVGIGTGRRADAMFCTDAHRSAFHNRARSKGA